MMEGDRKERFEAANKEQFEALGRFVQAFEQMVFTIRGGLEFRLQQESPSMVYFTRMLFHHPALTAWPLWEMLRGVIFTDVNELRPVEPLDSEQFHAALAKIGKEVSALISERNNILHGTPFIGWVSAEQEDFTEMQILKWGISAKGWKETETPKTARDLLDLVARCESAEKAIRQISVAATMPKDMGRQAHLDRAVEQLVSS